MAESWAAFSVSSAFPWWIRSAFRFVAPSGDHDPLQYRQAVLGHAMMQDLVAFLGYSSSDPSPYYAQERIDEQGQWLPLQPTLWALDIGTPPDGLFPLPPPRPAVSEIPNEWLITLDEALLYACQKDPIWAPLGLVVARLLPVSSRPIAQLVTMWLLCRVLPVCARNDGPNSWEGLDVMLNPVV